MKNSKKKGRFKWKKKKQGKLKEKKNLPSTPRLLFILITKPDFHSFPYMVSNINNNKSNDFVLPYSFPLWPKNILI